MAFLIWLLGVAMLAASGGIVYKLAQKVIWPYNRFVFEHTNEYGVLVFETYEDKVAHDKYKAKNQAIEFVVAIPVFMLFVPGIFMFTHGVLKLFGGGL